MMPNELIHRVCNIVQLWILFMVVLVATDANAAEINSKKISTQPDTLSLSLSMTLSSLKSELIRSGNMINAGDAKQLDAATKEKKLRELNAQIAELELVIKSQQKQLDVDVPSPPAVSTVVLAPVLADLSGVGHVSPRKPEIVAPDAMHASNDENGLLELLQMSWVNLAIALILVLLAVSGFVWYRRSKAASQWKHGTFHDLSDVNDPEWVKPPAAVQPAIPVTEQTIIISPHENEKSHSILPPEYEMLEEVDIYLRFGHDKLAEELLKEALKVNPKNPQTFLKLLRIYFARENRVAYQEVAQQLKQLGDAIAWAEVAEMGRNLDPDNVLYQ